MCVSLDFARNSLWLKFVSVVCCGWMLCWQFSICFSLQLLDLSLDDGWFYSLLFKVHTFNSGQLGLMWNSWLLIFLWFLLDFKKIHCSLYLFLFCVFVSPEKSQIKFFYFNRFLFVYFFLRKMTNDFYVDKSISLAWMWIENVIFSFQPVTVRFGV